MWTRAPFIRSFGIDQLRQAASISSTSAWRTALMRWAVTSCQRRASLACGEFVATHSPFHKAAISPGCKTRWRTGRSVGGLKSLQGWRPEVSARILSYQTAPNGQAKYIAGNPVDPRQERWRQFGLQRVHQPDDMALADILNTEAGPTGQNMPMKERAFLAGTSAAADHAVANVPVG
jgi:hypothetical protein